MSSERESEEKTNPQDPFESVTIRSRKAKRFLHKLDKTHELWDRGGTWIFRGQNCASWSLVPSLLREPENSANGKNEVNMIHNFVRLVNLVNLPIPANALSYLIPINERGLPASYLYGKTPYTWLALDYTHVVIAMAQHSGMPTRLLDFSYDPFVAAYFAADITNLVKKLEFSSNHMANYFLDVLDKFNVSPDDALAILETYAQKLRELKRKSPKEIAVWAIRADDLNEHTALRLLDHPFDEIPYLRAQKGVFLCTDDAKAMVRGNNSFDEDLASLIEFGDIYKFTLPYSESANLLRLLDRRSISPVYLMPSYEKVAEAVRKIYE